MTTLRRVAQATLVAALLATPLTLAGCISGQGPITVETRETRPFTRVEVGAGIRLAIAIGPAGPLEVSAQQDILPAIATDVLGDTLHVGANEDFTTTEPVTVTMSAPSITGISMSGGASATIVGLAAETLDLSIKGGARLTIAGSAEAVTLTADGGSSVDLGGLSAGAVSVAINGGATAIVRASDDVRGSAAGGARLTVRGNPAIGVESSGGANVVRE